MNHHPVTLRAAADADYDFMRRLYHSTRAEEMRLFPFDEAQKTAFLDQQFSAQSAHYAVHYPTCERNIIESGGTPIGRLLVDEWNDQVRIVDIALLPEWRGAGIGSSLLTDLIARAKSARKPVTIHVEAQNPAMTLYQRLGFEHVDSNGIYCLMRKTTG